MLRFGRMALLVPVLAFAGCAIFEPGDSHSRTLTMAVELRPTEVDPGGTTELVLRVTSQGTDPVTLQTTGPCIANVRVLQGNQPQNATITPNPCWDSAAPVTLRPGEQLERIWTIETRDGGGVVLPAGAYLVLVDFMARMEGGTELTDPGASLTVR